MEVENPEADERIGTRKRNLFGRVEWTQVAELSESGRKAARTRVCPPCKCHFHAEGISSSMMSYA
jgi:hypothetical protein